MNISVNNQTKEIVANTSITDLLKDIQQVENGIAVAINQEIITKSEWETKTIQENDEILIIQATQGG